MTKSSNRLAPYLRFLFVEGYLLANYLAFLSTSRQILSKYLQKNFTLSTHIIEFKALLYFRIILINSRIERVQRKVKTKMQKNHLHSSQVVKMQHVNNHS